MTGERRGVLWTSPFQEFFRTEAAGGALLVVCACAALALANSPWADVYQSLWRTRLMLSVGSGHAIDLDLHQWINDGLMAVFFLLVGLEIKREVRAGELASPRQATLPIAAALGGMLLPALTYSLTNGGGLASRGWAIPTATDIAFALGVLSLIAPNAPRGLKIFLAALAIVDDMGAVLMIAVFYTREIAWHPLGVAALILVALATLIRLRIRSLWPYLLLGLGLWFFVHESGVHATVAGVLLALTIPTRTRINAEEFSARARGLLDHFDHTETGDLLVLTSRGQQDAIVGLERASEAVTAPLLRLEHALHAFSAYIVMPLFAFSNAGVALGGGAAHGDVTLAVFLGLAAGKPVGITVASFAAVRLRLASLPEGVTWTLLHGAAWLGGIGFTMSLFIAGLAFQGSDLLDSAKLGIFGGSVVAAVVGAVVIRRSTRRRAAA